MKYHEILYTGLITYYNNQFSHDLNEIKAQMGKDIDIRSFFLDSLKAHKNARDPLSHIPAHHLGYFLSLLCLTTLLSQIIYTYFKGSYIAFQELTGYPTISWSIGQIKPWDLFEQRITQNRMLVEPLKKDMFVMTSAFFVEEMQKLIVNNPQLGVGWDDVKKAISNDPHVLDSWHGRTIIEHLKTL